MDSRESKEADSIRRRRECESCNRRFTTYERIDEIPYMVVKKDGRRERFDRQKILSGLLRACEKRPVPSVNLEAIVDAAEAFLVDAPERERTTSEIGELIMEHLKGLDTVAYIRFASVYRDFKDLPDFVKALEGLMPGSAPVPRLGPRLVPPPPAPEAPPSSPLPFKSTPLFPGVTPERPGPPKRRKSR